MIFKFILVWILAFFDVLVAEPRQWSSRGVSRYCDFQGSRKNYNATDLLRCIDNLAVNLVNEEAGRSTSGKNPGKSTARGFSFADILTGLFNNDQLSAHQTPSFPADTTSSSYQSNYPAVSGGSFDHSTGIGLNLFDAISSIARHDDYKCVPRILCEMASGKLPGRSLGKQTTGFFENLGKNTLMQWLTGTDIAGTSPLLNFARAMILGYSYKGRAETCYRAFPRCPRHPDDLVHYLNNHNGGFFRLFNRIQSGKYRQLGQFDAKQDSSYVRVRTKDIPLAETDRNVDYSAVDPEKLNTPRIRNIENIRETIFSNDHLSIDGTKIIFPNENKWNNDYVLNRLPKYEKYHEPPITQQNHHTFFPQETKYKRFSQFRFPSTTGFFSRSSIDTPLHITKGTT